eukprot:135719_1
MSTSKKSTDELLMEGFIRETNLEWYVSMDMIQLLLLFLTIGDNFDEQRTNKNITITYEDSDENKYGSKYQTLSSLHCQSGSSLIRLVSDYTEEIDNACIFHAFGTRQVSRVKYVWNVAIDHPKMTYVGIVEKEYVDTIYNNENTFIPELTPKDYFFSKQYHGYALCLRTGDIYHNNAKYGKPYVLNNLSPIIKSHTIITIELDLTGNIYGNLRFKVKPWKPSWMHVPETQYWNDGCLAYDDILVHKKYQLVVVMDSMVNFLLFDDLRQKEIGCFNEFNPFDIE